MAARILLAEDNKLNQIAMHSLLEKLGYQVLSVAHGREAVEAYAAGDFDAVLMDCQMPEMDGFEATRRIREFEQTIGHHTPIAAMTAHALEGDRERLRRMARQSGLLGRPEAAREIAEVCVSLCARRLVREGRHLPAPGALPPRGGEDRRGTP